MSALPITVRRKANGKKGSKTSKNSGKGISDIVSSYGFNRKSSKSDETEEAEESGDQNVTLQDVVASIPQSEDEALALCSSVNPQRLAQQLSFLKLTSKGFNPSHATMEKLFSSGATSADIAMLLESSPWATPLHEDNDFDALAIERGILSIREMKVIATRSRSEQRPFWQVALQGNYVTDKDYQRTISTFLSTRSISGNFTLNRALLRDIPVEWVEFFSYIPWSDRNGVYVFAATRPPSETLHQRMEFTLRRPVVFEIAEARQIKIWKERWLQARKVQESDKEKGTDQADFFSINTNTNAVQIVDQVLNKAFEVRASDIHLEPSENGGQIRFRIDGACHSVTNVRNPQYGELIARIKVSADMDITERRRPQGGHLSFTINNKTHNLRIATVPATHGEKVAIRLADTQKVTTTLDNLGLDEKHLLILKELAARPFGMLLATGPVGSGKTTTLYSCLHELDRGTLNVMSIEDPVEIDLNGVTQLQVNYDLGFSFVEGLRALLRQDPDAILVGEIRDEETARISTRASMTGLRVFSTLHTNDSIGAVNALRHFNISPHIIASSLQGIIAQRLLRRNCVHCSQPYELTDSDRKMLSLTEGDEIFSMKGSGCEFCRHTGYQGRVGIFEIFQVDSTVRGMILDQAGEREIRAYACQNGLTTLQQDCVDKIKQGLTSVDEYRRMLNFGF
jgi:type II secretory ATPase GspE/PulE/Tfp pilus assembly ATPase PilB-like protein